MLIKYLTAIPLIILALCPPSKFSIPILANSTLWLWLILGAGFLSFLLLNTQTELILKVIAIYVFVTCFTSSAPYLSFTGYILFISTCYYYLLCKKLTDYDFIFKSIQAIFFLNILMIVMQKFGGDTLMNFGTDKVVCFGAIGNEMWLASFIICLAPFLLIYNKLNIIPLIIITLITKSSGGVLALAAGALFYLSFKIKKKLFIPLAVILLIGVLLYAKYDRVVYKFGVGRFPVWKRTIELVNKHPFVGWGIATCKVVIPQLTKDVAGGITEPWEFEHTQGNWLAWRQLHNCWLQFLFEAGYFGISLFVIFMMYLAFLFFKAAKSEALILGASGMVMVGIDMCIHYPTRSISSVLIMVCFLAYFINLLKGGQNGKCSG